MIKVNNIFFLDCYNSFKYLLWFIVEKILQIMCCKTGDWLFVDESRQIKYNS